MKNKGNTLAEVLMILTIIGIVVAVVSLGARKNKTNSVMRYTYYNQLVAMQNVAAEILSKSEEKKLPDPEDLTDPDDLFSAEIGDRAIVLFCNAVRNEFNITHQVVVDEDDGDKKKDDCDGLAQPTDDNNDGHDFETSSTARFYRGNLIANNDHVNIGYTFWLDLNGERGRNRLDTGRDGNAKDDIFQFAVYPNNVDGVILLPERDSKGATDSNFLSAKVISQPDGNAPNATTTVVAQNMPYRDAVCVARLAPLPHFPEARADDKSYCYDVNENNYFANPANNPCISPTNPCKVVINRPAPPLIRL